MRAAARRLFAPCDVGAHGVSSDSARVSVHEPRAKLCGLNVAERNGERVGGVGRLGRFTHAQQRAHHQLHLLFVGVPVAGHAGLHLARRIAARGNSVLGRGQQIPRRELPRA